MPDIYKEFAETVHPLFVVNDWKWSIAGGYTVPTVNDIANIASWAHGECLMSEKDELRASTGRVVVEKKGCAKNEKGEYVTWSYHFLLDIMARY